MTPEQPFVGLDRSAADFYRWAFSDPFSPTTRGMVAEYLVACALGKDKEEILEWDYVDFRTAGGTVEVKTSAVLRPKAKKIIEHNPSFGISRSMYPWDAKAGNFYEVSGHGRHADIYVFCLQFEESEDKYNLIDVSQWLFYPMPTRIIDLSRGAKSNITLSQIRGLVEGASFSMLAQRIIGALRQQREANP